MWLNLRRNHGITLNAERGIHHNARFRTGKDRSPCVGQTDASQARHPDRSRPPHRSHRKADVFLWCTVSGGVRPENENSQVALLEVPDRVELNLLCLKKGAMGRFLYIFENSSILWYKINDSKH